MKNSITLFLICFATLANAQKASINEEMMSFRTYPYDDPDPVAKMTKHYPYFRFDGFTNTAIDKEWKIVILENDYIKVYVAPEIGGKVLGAFEKSTGEDFIYFNETVKFRDIAMRGAWTSGGIEFNFGSIGHAPSTASPVNYKMVENLDGSVSCFVGAPDLTSRTEWRVEVRLPADKAWFETNGFWYNPTGERTSLYNWMTASADATPDLEYYFPGHTEIGHGGEAGMWPVDEKGRSVSFYRNNDFGGAKSYHIIGSSEEYFGTFFHDRNFGMGHWAPNEERPGAKIWIWGLSRQGEIWVNLLTDTNTNVQYTELQTGFLFNQAGIQSMYTPYKHLFLEGNSENQFSEIWFPVKGTNGMTKADRYGTLNVIEEDGRVSLKFCALQKIDGKLVVSSEGKELLNRDIRLIPMQLLEDQLEINTGSIYSIDIGGVFTYTSTEREDKLMSRPNHLDTAFDWNSVEGLYTEAVGLERMRIYSPALDKYEEVLARQPFHIKSLCGKANILYRKMDYAGAQEAALKALSINTYDPDANFIYGMACDRLGKKYDALEGFGFALRSMKYRSAANLQMAQIYYREGDLSRAEKYAMQSLDYNRYNTEACLVLALIHKSRGNAEMKNEFLEAILDIDPLNAFAGYETGSPEGLMHFEMQHEIGLELAIKYFNLGETAESVRILEGFNYHPVAKYWLAFLKDQPELLEEAVAASPEFVFPYRNETAEVLKWAQENNRSWKTRYYLAILNWSKGNLEAAAEYFVSCGQEPGYAPFYLTRGNFYRDRSPDKAEEDYLKALSLDRKQWRTYHALTDLYISNRKFPEALKIAARADKKFPGSYIAGFDYARSLYYNMKYAECLELLNRLNILPNEGARSGHDIYRNACVMLAIQYYGEGNYPEAIRLLDEARIWPENLGTGKPYDTDERIEDFLQSLCFKQLDNRDGEAVLKQNVADYTSASGDHDAFMGDRMNSSTFLGACAMRDLGREEEADEIMKGWLRENEGDKIAQWAMAAYSNDPDKAMKLTERMKTTKEGTPWDPARNDASFELVKEIYILMNSESGE